MARTLSLCILFLLFPIVLHAQLSGSIESNSIYYMSDGQTGLDPNMRFGSNNYLKVDYTKGSFTSRIQLEYYPEPLQGYPNDLKGFKIPSLHFDWTMERWYISVGDQFLQMGSGMVFRSWEDRQMGLNNAIGGVQAGIRGGIFDLTLIYGVPRYYLKYSSTQVAGIDTETHFGGFTVGGSFINKIEGGDIEDNIVVVSETLGAGYSRWSSLWSVRGEWSNDNFSAKAEYVGKSRELCPVGTEYENVTGNSELLELTWINRKMSANITARRLQNMYSHIFKTTEAYTQANALNYLPSLAMEQTYMLAALNPYVTFGQGELGFSGNYFLRLSSWRFHVNGSYIFGLPSALPQRESPTLAYRDMNMEVEKKWSNSFKTILYVSIQELSPTHGNNKPTEAQNVFVLDLRYKFGLSASLRGEIQYLYSEERDRDWCAALAEMSFSHHWSVTLSDMYNHGSTGIHYYSIGAAYRLSSLMVSLKYGLNKEGLVCSGGVCRYQPAYKGFNLYLTYSF